MINQTITIKPQMRRAVGIGKNDKGTRYVVHMTRMGSHGCFVCEMEDGKMVELEKTDIRFLDQAPEFSECSWNDDETVVF